MVGKYETRNNRDVSRHRCGDRYEAYETDSGTVVVFDSENPRAWIESDDTVSPSSRT
ncbi:DUF7331 family protein [Halorussus lipolyticus]|uniref:DUF7331 family protein n=1 Tax=Halorussus lipolyticus TaxID=3034024 RepID=UPI0023E7F7B9|nr:hypothetical protein [Halorussus sp. DT80]